MQVYVRPYVLTGLNLRIDKTQPYGLAEVVFGATGGSF